MLRFCRTRLAVSAYTLFMVEQKKNPALQGLPIAKRGLMTSKLYKALGPSERAALEKRAKAMPSIKRTKKKNSPAQGEKKKKRPATEYAKFVKANISRYNELPSKRRLTAVAKLWKQQKQLQQQHVTRKR